jgi:pyridoxamine 5'-phosphate oxidase
MNQKNTLGLDICFQDLKNPIELFKNWMDDAIKSEPNDPNALALATSAKHEIPSLRMVLLKDFDESGFVFYTNYNSPKSITLKNNPNASMCFHWKTLLRQIRITGSVSSVSDEEADNYYKSRPYDSRIGAWASQQSQILKSREELLSEIEKFKKKYPNDENVPRPKHWSGWRLSPVEIEFWLGGRSRIHERLKYIKKQNQNKDWERVLLNP